MYLGRAAVVVIVLVPLAVLLAGCGGHGDAVTDSEGKAGNELPARAKALSPAKAGRATGTPKRRLGVEIRGARAGGGGRGGDPAGMSTGGKVRRAGNETRSSGHGRAPLEPRNDETRSGLDRDAADHNPAAAVRPTSSGSDQNQAKSPPSPSPADVESTDRNAD